MIKVFDHQEDEYLKWIDDNPQGFIANVDRAHTVANYPMVHSVKHKLLSSPSIGNFTTGNYFKFCSTDLSELDQYCQNVFGRPLTRCKSGTCKSCIK